LRSGVIGIGRRTGHASGEVLASPVHYRLNALPAEAPPLLIGVNLDGTKPWVTVFGMFIQDIDVADNSRLGAGASNQNVADGVGERHGHVSLQHRQVVRTRRPGVSLRAYQTVRVRQPYSEHIVEILGLDLSEDETARLDPKTRHSVMIAERGRARTSGSGAGLCRQLGSFCARGYGVGRILVGS
jgi:hypothetical protein